MKRLIRWVVDLLRPWHDDGLPDDLQMPENSHWYWTKGAMERCASLTVSQGIQLGVFQILGANYAAKAKQAWWPSELLLMEDVSLVFFELEQRVTASIYVAPVHIQRLAIVLCRYCAYHNDHQTEAYFEAKIDEYCKDVSEFYRAWNAEKDTGAQDAPFPF
jgi:hypothetical protein